MNNVPKSLLDGSLPPLASSCHDYAIPDLKDAMCDYSTPAGYAYIADIPETKDRLFAPLFHVLKLDRNKSGYYYLRKLTRPQRKAWIKANRTDMPLIPIIDYLQAIYSDMDDFISSGFIWSETPEGYEYWENIANAARWNTKRETLSAGKLYDILLEMQDRMNNSEYKFK